MASSLFGFKILPKPLIDLMGLGQNSKGVVSGTKKALPELVMPLKLMGVGLAWTVGDIVGHQLLPALEGPKTPTGYYRNKLVWAVPTLIAGRIASDWVGGPPVVRAAVMGTVANALMQLRYVFQMPKDFNVSCFLLHEAILIPLSLLVVGKPGEKLLGY